jgi:sugar O-acyltransferase (sialic acid O-acetyltransferase NeuD family)
MSKPGLILIGAGGHARACIDVVEEEGIYKIVGLVGLAQEVGTKHFGYEIIAIDSDLSALAKQHQFALIALGQIRTADHRIRLYNEVENAGFDIPTIIAPTAFVSSRTSIGVGTIVMHGAVINAGAQVGKNCIINTNSLIEHDAHLGDHCHIATGAILNGNTSIGAGAFIGSRAVVKEGVTIGENSLVGMGLTVRHNVANNEKYLGRNTR